MPTIPIKVEHVNLAVGQILEMNDLTQIKRELRRLHKMLVGFNQNNLVGECSEEDAGQPDGPILGVCLLDGRIA